MEALAILISLYLLIYIYFIVCLVFAYGKVAYFLPEKKTPLNRFSVVIPFRNEEKYLPALLSSFAQLNYPANLLEFIFIDDASTDSSATIVNKWRLSHPEFQTTMIDNVRLSASPKKDAIVRSLTIALHPWILTTDADCIVPKEWLTCYNAFIEEKNVEMICGPVKYSRALSFLSFFQQTDILALQGATIGAFGLKKAFMCNAANMAFCKKLFDDLGGFEGGKDYASGDDVLLLQKAYKECPEKVGYLKSAAAVVISVPPKTWWALLMQRIRWASKAKYYISSFGESLSLAVFFANLTLLLGCILTICGCFPWQITSTWLLLKFLADYSLALRANVLLQQRVFFFPILTALVYPIFSTLVGLFALYGKYSWKGRHLR